MNVQTLQQLQSMSDQQLADTAKQQGIRLRGKPKRETIIDKIMQHMLPPTKTDKPEQVEKPKVEAIAPHSEEAVREAIQKYTDKGMEARFPGDGTWHFKHRGAEDSGNLAIPLRVIVMKAGTVSQGARVLRTHSERDFDQIPTNPNSRYASRVLA